jgi:hypothetical protein
MSAPTPHYSVRKMMLLKIMMLNTDTVIPLDLIQSVDEIFDVILPSGDLLIDILPDPLAQDFL